MPRSPVLVSVVAALGLLFTAVGCGSSRSSAGGRLEVVAAENFWGSIATQLGGPYVEVTSIITNPNADPHLYESTGGDAEAIASAKVVIDNGVGYDEFMSKLLGAASVRGRVVVTAATVEHVTGSDPNPHLWYAVDEVPQVAKAIDDALIGADPAHRGAFIANLSTFDASLQPVEAVIGQIRSRFAGAPVAYTERVPGYLLQEAGLDNRTPAAFAAAVEDGTDPSPAASAAMTALMTGHEIRVLLYNSQTVSSVTEHIRALAADNGVAVIGVSETLPSQYPTYQAWQLAQDHNLLEALSR